MSVDLETQIHNLFDEISADQAPVTLDEMTNLRLSSEQVRPLGVLVRTSGPALQRTWGAAVAAGITVLVLIGGIALLNQATDSEPPVGGSIATTIVPETVPVEPVEPESILTPGDRPEPCESPSTWSRVCDSSAGFDGAAMFSVTAGGPGFVAVGGSGLDYYTRQRLADFSVGFEVELPIGAPDAIVWTSADGLNWSRVPNDAVTFGGDGRQQMFSVTSGGPGLVAVGTDGQFADGEADAAVWTSPDGFSWTRVLRDDKVFGGPGEQRMVSVAAGGPGLVAVGFDGRLDNGETNAAVWVSPDGITWSRVPRDEAVFGGEGIQKMLSVSTGGPGLVAVGLDGQDGEYYQEATGYIDPASADAAVWTSPDGFTWTRVPDNEPIFGGPGIQQMVSVTAGGPGLVAVGSSAADPAASYGDYVDAAVWTSSDGWTWSRVPHDPEVFDKSYESPGQPTNWLGNEKMTSVIAGGPGLIAVGFTGLDDLGWDAAVWTSPDGFIWSLSPRPDSTDLSVRNQSYDRMLSVAMSGSRLVAVGEDHSPLVAAVWNN
ncbi:MAG: hypothetical protein ACC654_02865 [Acidimicrobiia bacterium]